MENYFPSKIKVTYAFPQDFSSLWVKKKQQYYLSEGEFATGLSPFSVFKISPVLNKKKTRWSQLESDPYHYFI